MKCGRATVGLLSSPNGPLAREICWLSPAVPCHELRRRHFVHYVWVRLQVPPYGGAPISLHPHRLQSQPQFPKQLDLNYRVSMQLLDPYARCPQLCQDGANIWQLIRLP